MNVKSEVLQYLSEHGEIPGANEAEKLSYEYIDNKLLDSFAIVQMVVEFESRFGIRFTPAEMQSDDFHTIGGLISIIDRLREEAGVV